MSNSNLTPRQIERWVPDNLTEIVGCEELKAELIAQLRLSGQGPNILISGEPGSGKTSAVKAFVKTLNCPNRSGDIPIPCGVCEDCKRLDVRKPEEGILTVLNAFAIGKVPLHYHPVNCGRVSESELKALLDRSDLAGQSLIHLDEVHRIVRRGMDQLLLKPLEELDCVFIASSVHTDELDPMFLRRFAVKVSTSAPTEKELAFFIAGRCRAWGIEYDNPGTIALLAQRSNENPARSLTVLSRAASTESRTLTVDLINKHKFLISDEPDQSA